MIPKYLIAANECDRSGSSERVERGLVAHRYACRRPMPWRATRATVRCQINRPVANERGPFVGLVIEVGPVHRAAAFVIRCLPARRGDALPLASKGRRARWNDTASRSTTVANPVLTVQRALIVCQSIRPAQVRSTRRADLFVTGQRREGSRDICVRSRRSGVHV